MESQIKNYGLVISDIEDPQAYTLGGLVDLPKIVLHPDGNWQDFLPVYEPQFNSQFDSYGCTVFGTENVVETLLRKLTGNERNFSERFIYILAKIRPPGADPHDICEVVRRNGLIENDLLPMTATWEEFITPDPMTVELLVEGQKFQYEVKHTYVWRGRISKDERTKLIREHLRYSPLGVSVTAWFREGEVYVDNGQPNTHWCVLYGESEQGWLIFDSYDHSKKILSRDHNIQLCKRFMLVEKKPVSNWTTDIIKRLWSFIKDLCNRAG